MQIEKIKAAAKIAKSKTDNRRWLAAIDKAVAGVESGWWIITELVDSVAVTTETGKTYFANGVCQCEAFNNGQPCKHRALYRLLALCDEAPAPRQPQVVRSIERDQTGAPVKVVRCDGWAV